ncbi:MAG TPA: HEAT repeat domain-containing protein, partial [Polyangiaceae bacterium]|nr:HEAT repeat domain-containing protein [Polyangiaceae bacterium]
LGLLPSIDDSSVAAELVAVLGKSHDERALPALLELLRSGDTDVHASAIRGLGELPQREAAPILCSLLKVGSANEFDQAAEALARLAPATLVQELASLLESNNAARRMLAAVGLGRMLPNAEARRMVLGLLDSDEPPLVAVAARFLSRAKEPGIVDKLLYLARSDVPGVRMAAVRALGDTVDEGARAALKSLYDEQSVPLHVVLTNLAVDSSPEAQSALLGHLSEPGEDAIGVIQSFVPSLPDSTRRAIAARVATERDPERYRSFVEALSASADPDLVPLLREALREHSGVARRAATRALISLDVPEAEQLLDGLLNSDDPDEQSLGFESLTERGDAESLTRLAALAGRKLEDESLDAFEASRAFSVLKFRSPERAAQLLDAAFSRGPASTRARMLSLGNGLGQLAIPTCLRALTSDDSGVVEAAIDLAQSLGGERVSRALLGIARDPRRDEAERRSAANALKSIGGPVAREQASLLGSLLEEEEEAFECPWSEP